MVVYDAQLILGQSWLKGSRPFYDFKGILGDHFTRYSTSGRLKCRFAFLHEEKRKILVTLRNIIFTSQEFTSK